MKFELNYVVDLADPVTIHPLNQLLFYANSAAHELTVRLRYGLFPVGATGKAYFTHINSNITIEKPLTFNEELNSCSVVFPDEVYETMGPVSITVQITEGTEKTTILVLDGEVRPSKKVGGN